MSAPVRFGVFLRPDPLTCAAVTRVTDQLRAQYGLVSAGAFPPHITLAGSLQLAGPESDLVEALTEALRGRPAFPVANAGVRRLFGSTVADDVHEWEGRPNAALVALAEVVDAVVRPRTQEPTSGLGLDLYRPGRWHAHLSLASHDLADRLDLVGEVEAFVRGLAVEVPASFVAEVVTLYALEHPTWTGSWWQDLRWSHRHSWSLPPASSMREDFGW